MGFWFNWMTPWPKPQAGSVLTLVAMADPTKRRNVIQALERVIRAEIVEVDNKHDFQRGVTFNEVDLIVADAELNGCLSFEIIEQIRFGRLHCHPFPIVVMLCAGQEAGRDQHVIDCGADLVLPAHSAAALIGEPLARLLRNRKPFVVSAHYVGPERRAEERQGESSAASLLVPNPLTAKASTTPLDDYRRELSLATHTVAQLRRSLYNLRPPNTSPPSDITSLLS